MSALCESDIINEETLKRFNKLTQAGKNPKYNEILNQVRAEHELPPIYDDVVDDTQESPTEKELTKDDKQAYFWWKFKHDFFGDIAIQILSGKTNGDTLILLYIKLITLSLKCNGYICYEGVGGDLIEELTVHLHRSTDICAELIETLQKHNLITLSDDKETICIKNFADFTGADTPKTRMRNSRERNKQQKSVLN